MEILFGLVYDAIGIKAIRKEKNPFKKLMLILAFPVIGFLLIAVIFSL